MLNRDHVTHSLGKLIATKVLSGSKSKVNSEWILGPRWNARGGGKKKTTTTSPHSQTTDRGQETAVPGRDGSRRICGRSTCTVRPLRTHTMRTPDQCSRTGGSAIALVVHQMTHTAQRAGRPRIVARADTPSGPECKCSRQAHNNNKQVDRASCHAAGDTGGRE